MSRRFRLRVGVALVASLTVLGCDEGSDDGATRTSDRDVPEVVEGCPDGDMLVEIGATRACLCDDGTEASQTCLSTGAFADCQCVGGGW